jgi:hypothetical protein
MHDTVEDNGHVQVQFGTRRVVRLGDLHVVGAVAKREKIRA